MPKFAANLSMLFSELALPQRFAAAASAGFGAVEIVFDFLDRIAYQGWIGCEYLPITTTTTADGLGWFRQTGHQPAAGRQ